MRQSPLLKRGVVTILFVCQIFSCFHGYGYISCLQNLLNPTLWLLTWFVCTFSLCQKLLQSYISNKVCGEYWVVGIYGTAQAHNIDQSSSYRSLPTPSLNKRKKKVFHPDFDFPTRIGWLDYSTPIANPFSCKEEIMVDCIAQQNIDKCQSTIMNETQTILI